MKRYCMNCKKEIPRGQMSYANKKYQAKKYCNTKCHHEAMKKEFEYNCYSCGEKVIRTKDNITTSVFCNDICKGRYQGKLSNKSVKTGIKFSVTCKTCNKTELVPPSRKDRNFCSSSCRAKHYAKIITEKQKNQVETFCNNCSKKFNKKASDIKNLNFCKSSCMYEYYSKEKLFTNKNSGTWNGGKKTYYGENWLSQRRIVRKRDNYTCQKCGITEDEYGQELSFHHIIPFVMFDDFLEANIDDNLVSVCEPCHRKIHSGENHPSKFFKNSVDDIV